MEKIIIYTCITGKYDPLIEPKVIDPNFEYHYFSEQPKNGKESVWHYHKLEKSLISNVKTARYYKTHPHELFPEAEYSIWIDSNLEISDESVYSDFKSFIAKNKVWGGIKHNSCDCIYDEATRCVVALKSEYWETKKQIKYISRQKFPRHFGLMETNIIIRQHNQPKVIKINEAWWNMIEKFTSRDQLSQSFVFWEYKFNADYIFNVDITTWNHPGIKRIPHGNYNPNSYLNRKLIAFNHYKRQIFNRLFLWFFGPF